MKTIATRFLLGAGIVLAITSAVHAEDVEKKFRIGFAIGNFDTQDEIKSDSANFLQLIDEQTREIAIQYADPRNDLAAIGSVQIESARRVLLTTQYAFTKIFLLEAGFGYQKGDVGNIEMQAQFDREELARTENYKFHIFNVKAGTMTQVPIQLTAIARFRPKAILNPYIGAGVGYLFVGFEPSSQLNNISLALDKSTGVFTRQGEFPDGFDTVSGTPVNLSGAQISALDSFEWHLAGGAEFGFHKKWAAFVDTRYTWNSREFHIGFNGGDSIGVSVPNGTQDQHTIYGETVYGTYHIEPGVVDGGCLVPNDSIVAGAQVACAPQVCSSPLAQCTFVSTGLSDVTLDVQQPAIPVNLPQSDGQPDPGFYYLKGGKIKYGGLAIQIGIRFTF